MKGDAMTDFWCERREEVTYYLTCPHCKKESEDTDELSIDFDMEWTCPKCGKVSRTPD